MKRKISYYVRNELVGRLLSPAGAQQLDAIPTRITLLDQRIVTPYSNAAEGGVDYFFHLASIPGGAAEQNFDLGLQIDLYGAHMPAVTRPVAFGVEKP